MNLEVMNTLTVAELESVVEAINKLQAHYRREITVGYYPMCRVNDTLYGHPSISCAYCPWQWFDEDGCANKGDVNTLKRDRPQWWCDKRLGELAEWERVIQARIDELKEGRTE
jgi:hypothetical protein